MTYHIVKIVVTTALIVLISEVAKRSTLMGAILASVPLVSVLAMIWPYFDTRAASQRYLIRLQSLTYTESRLAITQSPWRSPSVSVDLPLP